ncbi:hypothetical protein, partial [Pseudomonas fragi]|uniref:hypothetical protein n=1 Tax=Pseudomonas fragi TaxID=296 RepID=UPI001E30DE76
LLSGIKKILPFIARFTSPVNPQLSRLGHSVTSRSNWLLSCAFALYTTSINASLTRVLTKYS